MRTQIALIVSVMVMEVYCVLNIVVTPASYTINHVTNYVWSIQFESSGNGFERQWIRLNFPDNVTFSPTSKVYNTSGAQTQLTAVSVANRLNISISNLAETDASIQFLVTDVINPGYAFEGQVSYSSNFEVQITQTPPTTIKYNAGILSDCQIAFEGFTGTSNSTSFITFTVLNSINENTPSTLTFNIQYNIYTSSTQRITSNGNIVCSYSVDGGAFSENVTAIEDTLIPDFTCTFNSKTLTAGQVVTLKLSNVQNPFTSTQYSIFQVSTGDGTYEYDRTDSCTNKQVTVVKYPANFGATNDVNTQYSSISIVSTSAITVRINPGDTLSISYIQTSSSNINLLNCGNLLLTRTGDSSIDFIVKGNQYEAATQNRGTAEINLYLLSCTLVMPSSISPVPFSFKFFRNSLTYMEIEASLAATFTVINQNQVNLTIEGNQIGTQYPYDFFIGLSQPLGVDPRILISLPIQIGNSAFTGCNISIDGNEIGTKICSLVDSVNNVFEVKFTRGSIIPQGTILKISLQNLINPNDPQSYSAFDVELYYDSGDGASLVEKGTSLLQQAYSFRLTTPQIQNNQFTVNQLASIVVLYSNAVNLPINSRLAFTFTSVFTNIVYTFFEINGTNETLIPSQSGQTFTLTYNQQIQRLSSMKIGFSCRIPSFTGTFGILDLTVTDASGNVYETTSQSLNISVTTPAQQSFDVIPQSLVTGEQTSYRFYFFSNIHHDLPFLLEIEFPADVSFTYSLNGNIATCSNNCQPAITDESQNSTNRIRVTINETSTGNSYDVTISNIINPSVVGITGNFLFKTLTPQNEEIVWGTSSVTIEQPNLITASLDPSQKYFRSNTGFVKLSVQVTNKLTFQDYFLITFQHHTYSQNINKVIECPTGTCSKHSSSTSSVLVVQIVPLQSQIHSTSMDFTIDGLISSSTTNYLQSFDTQIKSFSAAGFLRDQGTFSYRIDCGSTAAIRSLNCRTCNAGLTQCESCYESEGYFLFGTQCTNNCGNASQFQTFPNSGVCQQCISPCATCYSADSCRTCINGFYLYENRSCLDSCIQNQGLYSTTLDTHLLCNACWDPDCIFCTDGSSSSCEACNTSNLLNGRCEDNCGLSNTYIIDNICYQCDVSCDQCQLGSTNRDCIQCASGYYNVSNECIDNCPTGTVIIGLECGCNAVCRTCFGIDTNCTSCTDSSALLYNGQCLTQCPTSTYNFSNQCLDCSSGCLSCVRTGCSQCLGGYSIYNGQCYSQCNTLGDRFTSVNGFCLQCPEGCDVCDSALVCSVCLSGYVLSNSICESDCAASNTCPTTTDALLPIPGSIAACLWFVLLIILKLVMSHQLYIPYSFIYFGSVIELILVIVLISLSSNSEQRLLQDTINYTQISFGLLIAILCLNYLLNIFYIFIFCKYLRKLIPDRQIDFISNYAALVFATLLNFKLGLIAFSKMFPKPEIPVDNPSKLTPIHYLCGVSFVSTILIIAAAATLIYNETPLSTLFMLSIDLMIISIINMLCSIWMMAKSKPSQYFETNKRYELQENYKTEEDLKVKEGRIANEMNISKAQLVENAERNSTILVVENCSQSQNDHDKEEHKNLPLPIIPVRSTNINLQKFKEKRQNSEDEQSKDQPIVVNIQSQKNSEGESGLSKKKNHYAINFSKLTGQKLKPQNERYDPDQAEIEAQFQKELKLHETNSAILYKKSIKPTKLMTQRSGVLAMGTGMKKKKTIGYYDSQAGDNVDEVDFETIIQSKMIDKTQLKKSHSGTKTELGKEEHIKEEISPSWFNFENQRFDGSDDI